MFKALVLFLFLAIVSQAFSADAPVPPVNSLMEGKNVFVNCFGQSGATVFSGELQYFRRASYGTSADKAIIYGVNKNGADVVMVCENVLIVSER